MTPCIATRCVYGAPMAHACQPCRDTLAPLAPYTGQAAREEAARRRGERR